MVYGNTILCSNFYQRKLLLWCTGVGHSCRTIQCDTVCSSAGWEHWRNLLHRQWGFVRHLFPYTQADNSDLWWPQPSRLSHNVWCHHLSPFPRPGLNLSLFCNCTLEKLVVNTTVPPFQQPGEPGLACPLRFLCPLIRSTLQSQPNKVGLKCTSVRKKFVRFQWNLASPWFTMGAIDRPLILKLGHNI